MGEFKVEKSVFKTPPEESYWLDLVWIELVTGGKFGDSYRWHWKIADVDGQLEWKMCRATTQTATTPTTQNSFGKLLKVLNNGVLEENQVGTTDDLVLKKYRIKGFLKHNKKTYDGDEVIFCNVKDFIEGSAKADVGIGINGASEKMKENINKMLLNRGLPLLELDESKQDSGGSEQQAPLPVNDSPTAPKRQDLKW